jgi:predicted alpha/beta superfamily hydrolase
MKKILLLFITSIAFGQVPNVSSGKIQHIENFPSKYVDARNIDVWMPDGYSISEKYAVLYMHDGQMLYDAATTWNKQSWEVDEVAGKLITEGTTKKFIVVGIWNNGQKRHPEYFPQKPYESLDQSQKDTITAQLQKAGRTKETFQPISDRYLKFITSELKPYIDQQFSTLTDRKNTCIAGSSMGGLISMYAICEYPEIFGGAACISTHWPGTFSTVNNPIPDAFYNYMNSHLPDPNTHLLYFDYGNKTLDALYPELQKKMDALMLKKGFTTSNWTTQFFEGKDHSEKSWAERLPIPFEFLLKK